MADIALTDEQKQELLEELYRMIVEAEGNAVDYDDRNPFATPGTEEEQRRYTVPLIKDLGTDDELAGNINVRELLEGFGADLLSENNIAAENIETIKKIVEAAKESENAAAESAEGAAQSASNAAESERNASASETNAKESKKAAAESEVNAKASEEAAKKSEEAAAESESNAATSEENAAASEEASDASARLAERYATGSEGGVPVEDGAGYEDNAEFYKELAAQARSDTEELKDEAAQYVDEGKRIYEAIGPVAQDALDKISQLETKVEEVMQMRRAWSQTIGDGTTKVFVLRHNLLSYDYIAQVWSNAENHPSRWRMEKTDLNTVTIRFDTAPPQDGITVSIIGIDKASVGTVDWQDVQNIKVTADQLAPENALTTEEIKAAFDARK